MSNATAVAPERATKAPPRAKVAPATVPVPHPAEASPKPSAITEDEALVSSTLAEQLRAIYGMHSMQMSVNGSELLHAAADDLEAPQDCERAIHKAAAIVYGAIAVERADHPGSPVIDHLEVVYQSLRTASTGYSFEEAGCEAMAEGIRAGQRQYRDRPAPPIRRIEDPEPRSKGYSHAQMKSAFEFVASAADNVRNILMMAQTADEDWEVRRLVDAAELMVRHIGASADVAVGVNVIGDLEHWNYGPNFRKAGDAA